MDKSLVTAPASSETRFTQLQTLWQYGRERLDDSDDADTVRAAHAAYYAHTDRTGLQRFTRPRWAAVCVASASPGIWAT